MFLSSKTYFFISSYLLLVVAIASLDVPFVLFCFFNDFLFCLVVVVCLLSAVTKNFTHTAAEVVLLCRVVVIRAMSVHICDLPYELKLKIASYLRCSDLPSLALVSKEWCRISSDDSLFLFGRTKEELVRACKMLFEAPFSQMTIGKQRYRPPTKINSKMSAKLLLGQTCRTITPLFDGCSFKRSFDPALADNKAFMLYLVRRQERALSYASLRLRGDCDVVFAAVKAFGGALEHAAPEMRASKEVVVEAVKQLGSALQHASAILQADKEVVLIAVRACGYALVFAAPEMRGDKEVALAAISQDGRCLRFCSEDLRSDKQFVLEAVRSMGSIALKYISEDLRSDEEVLSVANTCWT